MHRLILGLLLGVLLSASEAEAPATSSAVTVGPNPSAAAFFESKVRPVLVEHCYECHAGAKKKGGLHVDTLAALLVGGEEQGPAVIPGDVQRSALLRAVRWEGDSDFRMPPKKKLSDAAIHDLERWVELGAPWPEAAAATATTAPPATAPRPPLIGRLHPIAVHMPIACLLLAVLAELLVMVRGEQWHPATVLLVTIGAAGAAVAVLTGTNLASDQDPHLLSRHELLGWLTLSGALIAAGMLLAMRWVPMRRWPLLAVLVLTAGLAGATGHIGGEMTWGMDWLPF